MHGTNCRDQQLQMIESLLTSSGASVVVIAPHPDDESIATGGLIQLALKLGARVTVVVLTDGDDNPWPQRVMERRLSIGSSERARWGIRRREEVRSALAVLGVTGASTRYFGLHDQGVTNSLVAHFESSIAMLTDVFREVRPTTMVIPGLADRHPDHSAAHVMCCVALASCGSSARLLSYMVHGDCNVASTECPLDANTTAKKQRAVNAHTSQLILSRKRITKYAQRPERFAIEPACSVAVVASVQRLPWRIGRLPARFAEVVVATRHGAWTVPVESTTEFAANSGTPRCVRDDSGELWLRWPEGVVPTSPAFAKLRSRLRSPWIYDHWGWVRLGAVVSHP